MRTHIKRDEHMNNISLHKHIHTKVQRFSHMSDKCGARPNNDYCILNFDLQ